MQHWKSIKFIVDLNFHIYYLSYQKFIIIIILFLNKKNHYLNQRRMISINNQLKISYLFKFQAFESLTNTCMSGLIKVTIWYGWFLIAEGRTVTYNDIYFFFNSSGKWILGIILYPYCFTSTIYSITILLLLHNYFLWTVNFRT